MPLQTQGGVDLVPLQTHLVPLQTPPLRYGFLRGPIEPPKDQHFVSRVSLWGLWSPFGSPPPEDLEEQPLSVSAFTPWLFP